MSNTIVTNGSNGPRHVVNAPLTIAVTDAEQPGYLLSDIDSRLVKVRPMATPVDQISRHADPRKSTSMVVEYYSVDSLPAETTVSRAISSLTATVFSLSVSDAGVLAETDTFIIEGVDVSENVPMVFYVDEADGTNLTVRIVSEVDKLDTVKIASKARVIRMGRAAAELDVQTPQAQVLPRKSRNYCQIFRAQVEQSVLQRLSAKEAGMTLSDQEEMALMDMRLGIEKTYLFGSPARFDKGLAHGEVFMTRGVWSQAGRDFTYSEGGFTSETLIELSRMAFTGNAGSSRKVLVGGSGLIESISKVPVVKALTGTQTTTRWGIDFHEIHTNFGTLYVVMSEVFDLCGHADDGMIIDPENLHKYVHQPFRATPLDLRSSGQRNTEALVLSEASCLVLRYPDSHMRITKTKA